MSPLESWAGFWSRLSADTLDRLDDLASPDLRFVDPFNDVSGRAPVKALLRRMLGELGCASFVVQDWAMGAKGGYLRWDFSATIAGQRLLLEGMSEVRFDPDGKVILHRDHWDAGGQVYARVPLLGLGIRLMRKRLSG
jgi:steroid delta-isomerase